MATRSHPSGEDAAHQGHDGDRAGRSKIATVKAALVSPLRDRFDVKIEGGADWDVQGNITSHEYEITSGRDKVAEVSMKWFRVRDTYGIEVTPGQDVGLVLRLQSLSTRCGAGAGFIRRDSGPALASNSQTEVAGVATTEQGGTRV